MSIGPKDAKESDRNEMESALALIRYGVRPSHPVTFVADNSEARDEKWRTWLREQFEPILAPHFLLCHHLASQGFTREIIAADGALAIPEPLNEGSLLAAGCLLSQSEGGRSLGCLGKLSLAVDEGRCPGHFATVTAAHGAAFNVPALPALLGLGSFEWRSAGGEGMLPPDASGLLLAARRSSASLTTPLSGLS